MWFHYVKLITTDLRFILSVIPSFTESFYSLSRVVFMNLGRNSMDSNCSPKEIMADIHNIVERMKASGVQRVFVASVTERGKFPAFTGMNKQSFDKVRKSVKD